jgi:peptide/nickel transport system substrate-binding protein
VGAADVVASLKRWGQRNDSYGQALLDAAAAIETLDDTRFRIALKRPFPVIDSLATMTSPTRSSCPSGWPRPTPRPRSRTRPAPGHSRWS